MRIKKGTTVYVYSGTKVIAEYVSGSLSKEYIYAGSNLLATLNSAGTPTYSHRDHLSTRLETDGSKSMVRTYGSLPFGETWYETGTANKLKFTTYERDSDSQLDYAVMRYYSPRLGRFASADLLAGSIGNPQSLNRYSYVENDPVNAIDPLGLMMFECRWSIRQYEGEESAFITPTYCSLIEPNSPLGDKPFGGGGNDTQPKFTEKELRDRIARALELAACAAMYGGADKAIALLNRAAIVNIDLPMMPGARSDSATKVRELEKQHPDSVTASAPLGSNLVFVTNRFFSKPTVDQAATLFLHEMKHQNQKPNDDPNVFDADRPKDNKEISAKCKTAGEGD